MSKTNKQTNERPKLQRTNNKLFLTILLHTYTTTSTTQTQMTKQKEKTTLCWISLSFSNNLPYNSYPHKCPVELYLAIFLFVINVNLCKQKVGKGYIYQTQLRYLFYLSSIDFFCFSIWRTNLVFLRVCLGNYGYGLNSGYFKGVFFFKIYHVFCHFFKLMHEITVHELFSLDKKINDSDLAHKFGVMTNKILYSAKKKLPLQQLELRINFKELFCYLQPHIIQSILFWKRKRKNETKYFLLEFIVIAIPNRLLYFSFNSQCASAFFQNENHSTTPIVA